MTESRTFVSPVKFSVQSWYFYIFYALFTHVMTVPDFFNVFIPIGLVNLFKTMTEIIGLTFIADGQQIEFLSPSHFFFFYYVVLYGFAV